MNPAAWKIHSLLFLILATLDASAVAANPPVVDALEATCRITDGTSSGTAFLVITGQPGQPESRRHVLVTAAHVFGQMASDACSLSLRVKNDEGALVQKDVAVPIRRKDSLLWVRHPTLDVAAIFVDLPQDVACKPFEYAQLADASRIASGEIHVGQEVVIPCYPAQLTANDAGWPVLRKGSIASHPLAPSSTVKTMFIDYSHFGGDSGAPVVATIAGSPVVVALAFAMQRQTDKTSTPFEERVMHTPLGLAIAVQSPLIRETIAMLLEK